MSYARTFQVPVESAFARTLPAPLEQLLGRRFLAFPGVTRVEQQRPWGEEVGQRRVLHFSDGGRTVETLTLLEAPRCFGYRLSDVSGPMRLLVAGLDGLWSFEPDDTGTRVTWSWDINPTTGGRVVMPLFRQMWRGTAARCFDRLGEHLDRP